MTIRRAFFTLLFTGLSLAAELEHVQAGWEPRFVDNFHSDGLALKRWVRGQENLAGQLQAYHIEGIEVGDGRLRLKAINKSQGNRSFLSGGISSQGLFAQQYGYFELRARLPRGAGFWPAFWLMPVSGRWTHEIDIFEFDGARPNVLHHAFHYDHRLQLQHGSGPVDTGRDLSQGFNVYALHWTPERIAYLLNGVVLHEIRNRTALAKANSPMYVLLNLALASEHTGWISAMSPETSLKQVFEIDYIRVYQHHEHGQFQSIPAWSQPLADTQPDKAYDNTAVSVRSTAARLPAQRLRPYKLADTLRLTAHAPLSATLWISLHKAMQYQGKGRYSSRRLALIEHPLRFAAAGDVLELPFAFDKSLHEPGLYHVDVVVRDERAAHSNRSAARYQAFQLIVK